MIRVERLSEKNFGDFEKLTSCAADGGCYCAFWHGKWSSVEEWKERERTRPLENRELIRQKMNFGFHVGVLAYRDDSLLAWISVGPLTEYYWTWKRVAKLGEEAGSVAGITCITIAPEFRSQKLQGDILRALGVYGAGLGWKAIEGYPFETSAYERHGKTVAWPGKVDGFSAAGYTRVDSHWLNHPEWERAIYRAELGGAGSVAPRA
ncbi:MAG: hypothetical protein AAB250_13360 [Bdellovibrionota bacterium]